MTKIERSALRSTVIKLFLEVLRNNLVDPLTPKRPNASWIRSSLLLREEPSVNNGRKDFLIKESAKPGFPQVVVCDFNETTEQHTYNKGTDPNYKTTCELTIRVLDSGPVNRCDSLAGQISNILKTKRATDFSPNGISKMNWTSMTMPDNLADDYHENQFTITFVARLTEWV